MKMSLVALGLTLLVAGGSSCSSDSCLTNPTLVYDGSATGTGYLVIKDADGQVVEEISSAWPWIKIPGSSCSNSPDHDLVGAKAVGWIDEDATLCSTPGAASCAPQAGDPRGTTTFTFRAHADNTVSVTLKDP